MLRISVEKRESTWVLKVEGSLQGEWVKELRRSWLSIRDVVPADRIRVELADVQFMDAAGKILLTEMHREGVEITARGFFAISIREEIVGS